MRDNALSFLDCARDFGRSGRVVVGPQVILLGNLLRVWRECTAGVGSCLRGG